MEPDFDVIFLSYKETNARVNYERLLSLVPSARWIKDVDGIYEAYSYCAAEARTEHFFLVDGDNEINTDFFASEPNYKIDADQVYVYRARNAVNGLEYGYGGVKLVSKSAFARLDPNALDCITGCAEKITFVPRVASTTAFNTSPFEAWRSGFRECCMLKHESRYRTANADAADRLHIWCTTGSEKPFGQWAIKGAHDGIAWADRNEEHPVELSIINNYELTVALFRKLYSNQWT